MTAQQLETAVPPRQRPVRSWIVFGTVLAILAAGGVYWFTRPGPDGDGLSHDPLPVEPVQTASGPAWFRERTAESGLHFIHRNGEEADQFTMLEALGGGVALIDYDGDGLLDVFLTGGGYFDGPDKKQIKGLPCKLFKNLGNFRFKDVTEEVGLNVSWWYTQGTAVADYDRDGWPDLLVTGYGKLALFHNESDGKGGRRFVDVTEKVGLRDDLWSTSAGWADLDGEGFPSLYVCHYVNWSFANHPACKGPIPGVERDVRPPYAFKPLLHSLFRNDKGKSFRNVSAEQGFKAEGCGLGVVLADLNGDGRPDIYVANDTNNNFLFFNRKGKLEEKGLLAGAAVDDDGRPNASMGVDVGDYEGSGRASLWVTNFQRETHGLYQNRGQELFNHQSRAAGIAAIGQNFVGFGTGFIDVDNDGWEDLIFTNGHVVRHPAGRNPKQRPVLLRNVEHQGRRFFKDVSQQEGPFFQTLALGRGLAIGDLDNDGWPDVVVSHINSRVALLRNEGAALAPKTRWLGVKLMGRERRDVVGSAVILEGNTRKLTRFAKGGGSYMSAGDPRILFGLGDSEQVRRVTVKWSWGETQSWDGLEPNCYYELHEGQAEAKRIAYPPH